MAGRPTLRPVRGCGGPTTGSARWTSRCRKPCPGYPAWPGARTSPCAAFRRPARWTWPATGRPDCGPSRRLLKWGAGPDRALRGRTSQDTPRSTEAARLLLARVYFGATLPPRVRQVLPAGTSPRRSARPPPGSTPGPWRPLAIWPRLRVWLRPAVTMPPNRRTSGMPPTLSPAPPGAWRLAPGTALAASGKAPVAASVTG